MMEFNEPTIPEAIKKVIDAGAKKVIVTPVFLAPGNHTERDIPKILGIYKGDDDCGHHHHHRITSYNVCYTKVLRIITNQCSFWCF